MQTLLLAVSLVACLVVLAGIFLYWFGRAQPEKHEARITFTLPSDRPGVWAALTDYPAMASWWPAVRAVRLETKADGEVITWNTDHRGQEVGFRTRKERAPELLVREIVGDDLPFGGIWTFELVEAGGGATRVTLTENGFIKPPIFRGIARLFLKPEATMRDFEKHFTRHVATR